MEPRQTAASDQEPLSQRKHGDCLFMFGEAGFSYFLKSRGRLFHYYRPAARSYFFASSVRCGPGTVSISPPYPQTRQVGESGVLYYLGMGGIQGSSFLFWGIMDETGAVRGL